MLTAIAKGVASITSQQRSLLFKVMALIVGGLCFLIFFPLLLGLLAQAATGTRMSGGNLALRFIFGLPGLFVGLGLLGWAIKSFWSAGAGTPAHIAAPQRLVTSGPYRYCRNPIQLGAMFLYFGVGALAGSLIAGLGMFGLVLLIGTLYHRLIEEQELLSRFGAEYEEYRRRTPFLVPRFNRHPAKENSPDKSSERANSFQK